MTYDPYRKKREAHHLEKFSIDTGIERFEELVEGNQLESACILCKTNLPNKPFVLISLGANIPEVRWMVDLAQESLDATTGKRS